MISAIRAAPLRVLFLAVAVAVVGLMTVTDLPSASPVHAQEQAVTATRNATGESPPARPTDLQASAKHDSVSLTWTASTDQTVTHYAVLRRDRDKADAGVFKVIDGNAGSATSYTDRSVSPEGSYVYRVKAVSPTGVSQWSSYARADIPADPEDLAPSGLSAKVVSGDDGVIEGVALAWDAPAADAASVTGYEILRAVSDGDLATLVANTGSADTTYTDDTATEAGESYAYRVKALRGEEASQPSDRAVAFIPKVTTVDPEPGIAEEQNVHVEVWSATLFLQNIEGSLGCSNSNPATCSGVDILSDDDFDYDGASYTVTAITLGTDGTLDIDVSATPTDATIADLVLNVDTSNVFRLSDATVTGSTLSWASTGLDYWTEGRGVVLTLNAGNRPPVFISSSALREVPENSPAGTDVGAPVTADDPDGDTLTYTLEGTDAASFGIGSSTGQIQTISGVTYDFESDNTYFVTVKADDGNGGTHTIFVAISLTDEDESAETTAWVSNTAQTLTNITIVVGNADKRFSQGFTTGAETGGYSLGSVGVHIRDADLESGETLTVHIYTASATGAIDTLVHTLISPDSYEDRAVNLFTAPAGATLAANTDYLVVFEATGDAANDFRLSLTNSTSEDSGSATGWSIEDSRRYDDGISNGVLVISVNAAAEASAEVWSATLTPATIGTAVGCSGETGEATEGCDATLTDSSFDYDGTTYSVYELYVGSSGTLLFNLNRSFTDAMIAELTLNIGESPFPLSDATNTIGILTWANSGLSLTAGTPVAVSLTEGAVTSTDATLSELSLSGVTLSPSFAADTLAYTGSVDNSVTSTTVTATANYDGATVAIVPVDADAATDGHQVTLAVGDTAVSVTVTAEDGTTTQTYAVIVTRAAQAAPAVSSVDVTSEPGDDDTYAIGDSISGHGDLRPGGHGHGRTPRIKLRVGGGDAVHQKWADYTSGSGNEALLFAYTVQADDFDDNGIYIAADELELNGGTIQSSGGTDANLDYPLQGGQSGHNVDGVRPTPQSAATSVDGSSVIIIFSEPLSETTAPANAFTLSVVTGTAPAVSTATASGDMVTLGLASALTGEQVVTVTYNDATAGNDPAAVQDAAGNDAANFTQTVTNYAPIEVSADWGLIPSGLGAGAEFRLIFISSTTRNAASTDIADYNTFVQGRAAAGHADIQQYSSTFRVVGSTAAVDARDNTNTTYTADDKGVAIYWLGGAKVADDYEDFYDETWDDEVNAKDESGSDRSISGLSNWPLTGSEHDGTASIDVTSHALGAGTVTYAQPNSSGLDSGPLSSSSSFNNTAARPFYGLSPVFRVAGQVVTNTAPAFTTVANFSTNENQAATFQVTAMDPDAGDDVTYAITGGADLALFSINATSGLLAIPVSVDHENPADADSNNTYLVTVTATGGTGARALMTDQAITVTVTDVDEPPSFPAAPTVSAVDGSSDSLSVTWTAPGNSGKPDIESYDLQYRKGTTGNFTDGPQDVTDTTAIIGGLDADSAYQVRVRATNDEGDSLWSSAGSGTTNALAGLCLLPTGPLWSACLTVGEIDSTGRYGYQGSLSIGSLAPATFDVGTTTYTVTHLFDNDNVGGTTYVRIILSPILSQDDAGNLTLHLGDDTSLSFGDATYSTGTGISRHLWTRSAALGWSTGETIVVGITQEEQANTAPAFTTVANFSTNENQAATFQVTAMDPDDGDEVTYAITGGADQAKFDIAASSGVLTFKDAPDHENPEDADSNNVYLVTVTATGGTGARALTTDQAITVTVTALDEIWSATMTVGVNSTLLGWDDAGNYTGAALSDEDFDYGGDTYNLSVIRLASGSLIVIFNDTGAGDLATNATRDKLTLHVDGATFNFGAGGLNSAQTGVGWTNSGLTWSDGDTVELKITVSEDAEVALTSDPGADDTYAIGDAIEATATFGQAVTVTGTPQIEMQVGGETRTADYASGSGSANLVFSYTVVEGDLDADGVAVEKGLIDLNGGTILVGTTAAGLIHGAVSASTDHQVDGVRPIFVSAETNEAGTRFFITFSEPISAVNDSSIGLAAGVVATLIKIDGAVVELDPTLDFAHDTTWTVTFISNAVRDLAGNGNVTARNNPITNNVLAVCGTLPADRLWSACLMVGEIGSGDGRYGYASGSSVGTLVPSSFDIGTTTYTVTNLFANDVVGDIFFRITLAPAISEGDAGSLTLHLGDATLSLGDASYSTGTGISIHEWSLFSVLGWSEGDAIVVGISQANTAPSFLLESATREVAENSAAGVDVGGPVTATDTDTGDTLTYTLEGTDAASFNIDASSGQIQTETGVTYDHELQPEYSVTVKADDGKGGTDTIAVAIDIIDVEEPPSAPAAPTVSAVSGTTDSLEVTWTAPDNAGKPDIESYDLQYRKGTTGNWIDGPQDETGTTATIGGLDEDSAYQVQVRATNDEGDGGWSSPGSGSTNAPAEEMAETTVPADWSLIPSDLGPGDSFRLIFIGSSNTNASSSDIDVYNTFVQNLVAASGHEDIKALSATFRMLGSTEAVDARDNTATTTGTGVPSTGWAAPRWPTTTATSTTATGTRRPREGERTAIR